MSPENSRWPKVVILAGGRGKGHFDTGFKGGVHLSKDAKEIGKLAQQMLGHQLITKQTGPEGQKVAKVLVHEGINFDRELYFAILMDRSFGGPVMVASKRGGMDIEEVAEKNPEDIFTDAIDISKGLGKEQAKKMALRLVALGHRDRQLGLEIVGRGLQVVAALRGGLGEGRIGEVRRVVDAGAFLFCEDLVVEFPGHAFELGDHGFHLRYLPALLVGMEPLEPDEAVARLHFSTTPRTCRRRGQPAPDANGPAKCRGRGPLC